MTKENKANGKDAIEEMNEHLDLNRKPGSQVSPHNFFKNKENSKQALSNRSNEERLLRKHTGQRYKKTVYTHVKQAHPEWFIKNKERPENDLGVKKLPVNKFSGSQFRK